MSNLVTELITLDDNGLPIFNPIAKTLAPFKQVIVNSRKNGESYIKAQELATKKLAFIFYMVYYNSPYVVNKTDVNERAQEVKRHLHLPDDWDITPDIKQAMEFFDEYFQKSLSLDIIVEAREALKKTKDWFKDFDPKKNSIADLMKVVSGIGEALNGLDELEARVKKELSSSAKIKGGGIINDFEDPKKIRSANNPYSNLKL